MVKYSSKKKKPCKKKKKLILAYKFTILASNVISSIALIAIAFSLSPIKNRPKAFNEYFQKSMNNNITPAKITFKDYT